MSPSLESAATDGPVVVTDVQHLSGQYIQSGKYRLRILTWILGATQTGELTSAYLLAIDENGELVDYDGSSNCVRVFDDPSKITDVRIWNPIKAELEYAEEVKFISREDGSLRMVLGSRTFVTAALEGEDTACAWIPYNTCYPGGGCLACPDLPPACPCNGGQSNCSHVIGKSCPADGECPIRQRCQSDGDSCACGPI